MDFATLTGLAVGITVVTLAIATGSDFSIFLNAPGFLIVIGGTFAATMIKFPLSGFFISMPVGMKAAFTNDSEQPRDYIRAPLKITCCATVCQYQLTMKPFDQNFCVYHASAGSFFPQSQLQTDSSNKTHGEPAMARRSN